MRKWVRVVKNIEAMENLVPLVELNRTTKFSSLKSIMIQRIVLWFKLWSFSVQYTIIFYNWMADNNGRRYGSIITNNDRYRTHSLNHWMDGTHQGKQRELQKAWRLQMNQTPWPWILLFILLVLLFVLLVSYKFRLNL